MHNSAMRSYPRSPSSTIRIFCSAAYCRRVARRITLTVFSTLPLDGFFFALIALSSLRTMSWTNLLFNLLNRSNLC